MATALLTPSIFFARAEHSSALDLSTDRASRNFGGSSSRSKGDFVFVVNPKGANGRTGREWKKLLPFIRERLGPQCNTPSALVTSGRGMGLLRSPWGTTGAIRLPPRSGRSCFQAFIGELRAAPDFLSHDNSNPCRICESLTSGPFHAVDITREAIREGADAVIAVGGDGTLHEVVNGFFWEGNPVQPIDQCSELSTSFGLIPLGTGSDFARTFGWKNDPYEAVERIARGLRSKIDVGFLSSHSGEQQYFINVADIHLSAKAGYYASQYKRFGKLCYVIGALRAFIGHNNWDFKIKVDEGEWEVCHQVTALCIGNAKFFGGGMKITPTANPFSGNLEVVILQDFKWYDFVFKLHKLYSGTHLTEENVHTRSVRSIEIAEVTRRGDIYVQSDGEHFGFLPTRCTILPAAIEFFT